jgi:hypothetical protein
VRHYSKPVCRRHKTRERRHSLPGLNKALRKSAVEKTYQVEWKPISSRTNVWLTSFDPGESEFAIYAVQTQSRRA